MHELTWILGFARAQLCPFLGRRCGLRGPDQGRRAVPVSEAVVEIERQRLLAEVARRKWSAFMEGCVIFKLVAAVVFLQKEVKVRMAEEEIRKLAIHGLKGTSRASKPESLVEGGIIFEQG